MIVLGNIVECDAKLQQPITLLSVRKFLVDVKNYEHRHSIHTDKHAILCC